MSLFHGKNVQLGYIVGKINQSGSCTDVIGGTMTAGTFDSAGSGLITFAPPFVSAPIVQVSIQGGIDGGGATLTASNYLVQMTGVGVSNVSIAGTEGSGLIVGITAIGLQKL